MANADFTTTSPPDALQMQAVHLDILRTDDAGAASAENPQPSDLESAPPKHFPPRRLKISSLPLTHESAPFLRMGGKWLDDAGFHIGCDVQVTVETDCLVVRPAMPKAKSNSQIREERRPALQDMAARGVGMPAAVYPSLGLMGRVCEPTASQTPVAQPSKGAAASPPPTGSGKPPFPFRETRRLTQTRGTWPERIGKTLKLALGDVLFNERSRRDLHPLTIANHAQVGDSHYRALDRGTAQPNISTFIAIAWALDQDPRDLLDKLLLQMGLPPGTRPVISPQRG